MTLTAEQAARLKPMTVRQSAILDYFRELAARGDRPTIRMLME